jgi:hypothetical protein
LTVNSSSYPRWSRNMNVAAFPEQATTWIKAENSIYIDARAASWLELPVVAMPPAE